MKHVGLLSLALVLGCVAGAVTTQFTVPAARAGSDAPRWEYNCGVNPTKAQLDEAGAQGWELVSTAVLKTDRKNFDASLVASDIQFCFKRPL
jgi:hypothetical protein